MRHIVIFVLILLNFLSILFTDLSDLYSTIRVAIYSGTGFILLALFMISLDIKELKELIKENKK